MLEAYWVREQMIAEAGVRRADGSYLDEDDFYALTELNRDFMVFPTLNRFSNCFNHYFHLDEKDILRLFGLLVTISRHRPALVFEFEVDGSQIICPVRIRDGEVQPRIGDLTNRISLYCRWALLSNRERSQYSALDVLRIPVGLSRELLTNAGLHSIYGATESLARINAVLEQLKNVQDAIRPYYQGELYAYYIEQQWFTPSLFILE